MHKTWMEQGKVQGALVSCFLHCALWIPLAPDSRSRCTRRGWKSFLRTKVSGALVSCFLLSARFPNRTIWFEYILLTDAPGGHYYKWLKCANNLGHCSYRKLTDPDSVSPHSHRRTIMMLAITILHLYLEACLALWIEWYLLLMACSHMLLH